jgi:hypothetical protein
MRFLWLTLGFVLFSPPVRCQSAPACPAAEAMQALLVEVRQLRQDLLTVSATARRAQILIYRLQLQQAVARHAADNAATAEAALAQQQAQKDVNAGQLAALEQARDASSDSTERKQLEDAIAVWKAREESRINLEQQAQVKINEREQDLRIERSKLEQLQAQLDRIDSELESAEVQARPR